MYELNEKKRESLWYFVFIWSKNIYCINKEKKVDQPNDQDQPYSRTVRHCKLHRTYGNDWKVTELSTFSNKLFCLHSLQNGVGFLVLKHNLNKHRPPEYIQSRRWLPFSTSPPGASWPHRECATPELRPSPDRTKVNNKESGEFRVFCLRG